MNKSFFQKPNIDPEFKQSLLCDFISTYEKNSKSKIKFILPFAFGFTTLIIFTIISFHSFQSNTLSPISTPTVFTKNNNSFSENTVSFLDSMSASIKYLIQPKNSLDSLDTDLSDLESELNSDSDILSAINFDKLE